MTSSVKDLLHKTEKLNQLQKFGAFFKLLFFTSVCKWLQIVCPDLYPSNSLTCVVCCDNKEACCRRWDMRVYSHGSSFMITAKKIKKIWLCLLKILSVYKYTSVPGRETMTAIKAYAISTYKKKSKSQPIDRCDTINRKLDMKISNYRYEHDKI